MPLLWLRFATILYGVGLLYALLLLTKRGEWLSRIAVPAVGLGMVLHFVSLTEVAVLDGYLTLLTIRHAESALALLIGGAFMYLFVRYRTMSPGVFMFPLMFFLTFISEAAQRPPATTSPMVRSWLIPVHVALLLIGYAALFLRVVREADDLWIWGLVIDQEAAGEEDPLLVHGAASTLERAQVDCQAAARQLIREQDVR